MTKRNRSRRKLKNYKSNLNQWIRINIEWRRNIECKQWEYKRTDPEAARGLKPATLLKKRLWYRCFPVNFMKFLRTLLDDCFYRSWRNNIRIRGITESSKEDWKDTENKSHRMFYVAERVHRLEKRDKSLLSN